MTSGCANCNAFSEIARLSRMRDARKGGGDADCQHKGNLNEGPRIPLRYGTSATVICQACGRWRQNRPGCENDPWRTQAELAEALVEDDER